MIRSTVLRCLLLAALCTAGFLGGMSGTLAYLHRSERLDAAAAEPDLQPPDPTLAPHEVVQIQVEALARYRRDSAAVAQCFCLASPANQAVTGPLDRFTAMVLQPHYQALVLADHYLVGQAEIRGNTAAVLVTVVDANRRTSVFRFLLSKQRGGAVDGCWMTDQVTPDIAAHPVRPPDTPRPAI